MISFEIETKHDHLIGMYAFICIKPTSYVQNLYKMCPQITNTQKQTT